MMHGQKNIKLFYCVYLQRQFGSCARIFYANPIPKLLQDRNVWSHRVSV